MLYIYDIYGHKASGLTLQGIRINPPNNDNIYHTPVNEKERKGFTCLLLLYYDVYDGHDGSRHSTRFW